MEKAKANLSGKKILIVEDDPHLRETVKEILVKLKAEVRIAENGLVAKTILELNGGGFDLILSDIRMPGMDGIQLLKYSKSHYETIKVLIFTGFSEFLETRKASDLGADGFLTKPFRLSELVAVIEQIFSPQGQKESPSEIPDEQKYCCVHVDEFFSSSRLSSDIYIKVGASKFIKLAKESSEIEISRLQHFKEHKVEYLFVRTEDFHKYTGLNLKIANAIANSDNFSEEKKMRLFKHTSEMLVQQTFADGVDKQLCDNASKMLQNTIQTVSENKDLFELLVTLQARGDNLYSHSLSVSIYACLIASKIGWASTQSQYKVALSALFHDIGFKELPEDLHNKPRFKMSPDEVKLYETHPARGKEILLSIKGYPSDLTIAVAQHHESAVGTGYPLRLTAMKIHPIAKLLKVADELVEHISAGQVGNTVEMTQVLNELVRTKKEDLDADMLAGAFDLFQVPRPQGLGRKSA